MKASIGLTGMALLVAVTGILFISSGQPVEASGPTYIGAEKCGKMCHKVEYNSWLTTKHAKALDTLPAADRNKKECVQCHITGGTKDLPGVQCEACHGAGSEYKSLKVMKSREESIAAGLVIPNEKVCVTCHNDKSPHYKPFKYAERAKQVHDVKKK